MPATEGRRQSPDGIAARSPAGGGSGGAASTGADVGSAAANGADLVSQTASGNVPVWVFILVACIIVVLILGAVCFGKRRRHPRREGELGSPSCVRENEAFMEKLYRESHGYYAPAAPPAVRRPASSAGEERAGQESLRPPQVWGGDESLRPPPVRYNGFKVERSAM